MARTKGAKDLKKRKSRRDPKKKYMIRKGKFVPYKPKRSRSDPIKIWFWERVPMSKEGYYKWNKKIRPRVKRIVTKFHVRVNVPPNQLSTEEEISQLVLDVIGHSGEFYMMGFSHGKNRFHVKPIKLCKIVIRESREGLTVKISETYRLSRYWFWRGK